MGVHVVEGSLYVMTATLQKTALRIFFYLAYCRTQTDVFSKPLNILKHLAVVYIFKREFDGYKILETNYSLKILYRCCSTAFRNLVL